jgi:hypothetical protein
VVPTVLSNGCSVDLNPDYTEVQSIFGEAGSRKLAGVATEEWLEVMKKTAADVDTGEPFGTLIEYANTLIQVSSSQPIPTFWNLN